MKHREQLFVVVSAALASALAFALSRDALVFVDGSVYMEMAKQLGARGSLEIPNGLDVVDSPALFLHHTVKIGAHLYAKYPPLYAVLTAGPFALFGVRGLYLTNAIALFFLVIAYHDVAKRVLPSPAPLLSSIGLPLVMPLFPCVLMEPPHLISGALVLGALAFFARALDRDDARFGLLAGLLAGFALGVRVQSAVPAIVLVLAALVHLRPRAALGALAGELAMAAVVGAFNHARFGSWNPLSYGPASVLGAPEGQEVPSALLRFLPALVLIGLVVLARARPLALAVAALVIVSSASTREALAWMGQSAFAFLVNANAWGAGWNTPSLTADWVNKPLLAAAPLSVLAIFSRPRGPLARTVAWITIASVAFLSLRAPTPALGTAVMGFMTLSPRYLVEIMPLVLLLALDAARGARVRALDVAIAIPFAALLWVLLARDDLDPLKLRWLLSGTVALALALAVARSLRRERALVALSALAILYAAGSTLELDTGALVSMHENHARWSRRLEEVTPERFVLVSWDFARDAVFGLRARREVIVVDASATEHLLPAVRAFADANVPLYYYGARLELTGLEREYRARPVLADPPLFALEPK